SGPNRRGPSGRGEPDGDRIPARPGRNPQMSARCAETTDMEGRTTIIRTVDDVLDARAVTTVFQPIVRLDPWRARHQGGVGYEARPRGRAGPPWEEPLPLSEAAAERGRLAELDWVCRAGAYRAAIDAGLPPGLTLFVNAEPAALGTPCPPDLTPTIL